MISSSVACFSYTSAIHDVSYRIQLSETIGDEPQNFVLREIFDSF